MLEKWIVTFLFSFGLMSTTAAGSAFIGLNIGTQLSGLPPAPEIVNILKQNQITHVRLFNADAHLLEALSNTSIQVIVGVTNEEVLEIGEYPSKAASWINKNVAAYFPATNITAIAVGSNVLTTNRKAASVLVSAMNNLHNALVSSNLNNLIKVSSPQSMDIIAKMFPPSIAHFNSSFDSIVFQLLQFLKNTNSYFMLNAYPYYGFLKGNGVFPIEFALLEPLPPVKQIVDPNTLLRYDSMFDTMLDATYNSMAVLNFSTIPILVTESGWPSIGGTDATNENAATFIKNLVLRVQNDSGPPSRPSVPINTYVYEMFDEENKRDWGLFTTNGSRVYALSLSNPQKRTGNNNNASFSSTFCVVRNGADTSKLQKGLNWACGQGGANCSAIQKGEACYNPDTINDHASYSYNDYYQKMIRFGGDCDFDGTAMLTVVDPSE
ncbi:glucan endo-1,3-beta-glucosidase 4-like [Impatiens glandulifera]|uniref:glucan endo-1,3-beta-glucosidase 4-like n=1 Tax=Impatiens glandulifera TaxID=253017 RepID=UPI001FB10530|nr:glucan endo-1,3-beta-glucosidase 4-like [Impatiens glandulifera]XP_047324157.1 glucan endo-1,3-beta-glucosidase 4-like [Impatiens glandulifera]